MRTVRAGSGGRSEGIVLLRGGNPEASLHQTDDKQERGRNALKKVWQDSYDESTTIELHARVDMDGLIQEYTDAILERPAKVVKRAKVPQIIDRREIERRLGVWRALGFEVSSVETALDEEPALLTAAYLNLMEAVKRSQAVEETLTKLDVSGFETRAEALRARLKDPLRNPDIDAEVESLRDAVESYRQIEARRQLELVRERDSEERTKKVVELVIKQRQALEPEAPPPSHEEIARAMETPALVRDEDTHLVRAYTFDAFVVGESNRFAHGAAASVARQPASGYNPLILVSGPGLGKTHLLHAVGNRIGTSHPSAKVLYLSCDAFATQFEDSKAKGSLSSFRDTVRGVDCLLLDDLEALSGRGDIQEELLHTFNHLFHANKQLVLASDRAPKAIANLDERLVSRLESGLVAAIRPPERETRIAILERRARDAHIELDPDVLALIADLVEDNVRELQGAFNRVVAFSSLMNRPITRDLAKEVLRDVMGRAAGEEKLSVPAATATLVPGRCYLVEEDRPEEAFRMLAKAPGGGRNALVITRTNPKRIRERFSLEAERVLWLTDREGSSEETIAPALERIVYEIETFMSGRPRGSIVMDGIEYLVSSNSFDAVLKFVRRLVDTVSEGHYTFLISLGPATLKDQELKMLEREMEVVRVA